jgi:hypothetical protein
LIAAALASDARGQTPQPQVLDRGGVNVGALRGVVVWEARRGGRSALVRSVRGRVRAIPGARAGEWTDDPLSSGNFSDLDLGLDAGGRVVATYRLCGVKRCRGPFVVDVLSGRGRRLEIHPPRRCEPSGPAAMWRTRIATTLRCTGRRRSGVYVVQGRRARLVARTAGTRFGTEIDLVGETVAGIRAHEVWIASARASCRTVVARLPSFANLELVQLTTGRAWWGISTAADFGGNEWEYGTAAIGAGCAVSERRAITTFPELDWSSGSFAVDGERVYVGGRETGGVVSAPLG